MLVISNSFTTFKIKHLLNSNHLIVLFGNSKSVSFTGEDWFPVASLPPYCFKSICRLVPGALQTFPTTVHICSSLFSI